MSARQNSISYRIHQLLGRSGYYSAVHPVEERSITRDERVCRSVCLSVCVCVCLSAITSSELHVRSPPDFLCMFWQCNDTLCTSGFMDDVIFAHRSILLDVAAQLKRSAHAVLGLAVNCSQSYQLQANGRTGLLIGCLKQLPMWQRRGRSLRSMTAFCLVPHRMRMPPIITDVAWSVCRSACVSIGHICERCKNG